jgi:CRISPR-associated protein Cmr1
MPDLAFPRAEYGMPIIIEIRDEGLKPTLQPTKDHDRMASPLILRPIKFTNDSFASMIIRLNTPPLQSAYLKPGKSDLVAGYPISISEISDPKRSAFSDSPRYKFCPGGCSELDAFLSFARTRGFVKVI